MAIHTLLNPRCEDADVFYKQIAGLGHILEPEIQASLTGRKYSHGCRPEIEAAILILHFGDERGNVFKVADAREKVGEEALACFSIQFDRGCVHSCGVQAVRKRKPGVNAALRMTDPEENYGWQSPTLHSCPTAQPPACCLAPYLSSCLRLPEAAGGSGQAIFPYLSRSAAEVSKALSGSFSLSLSLTPRILNQPP